ncbi:MAG: hypothetical protein Tsb0013_24880 [Phycisphaerales bacterium]
MAKKKELSTLEAYRAKSQEAKDLANAAAKEIRDAAKEYMDELKRLSFEYQQLTGKSLPETQTLFRPGAASTTESSNGTPKSKRKRGKLESDYAGMTLPDAIKAALKGKTSGMKAGEIADEIGGQRASIAVALSNLAKEGSIERVGRGLYTSA